APSSTSLLSLFHAPAPTQIYPLSLHDALPISIAAALTVVDRVSAIDGDLSVRVGIETGEVLAIPGSDDLRVTGEAVNAAARLQRSEEHTSELQSQSNLVCRLLLEKKKKKQKKK